eukprot:gnl/TRDRNA2_/TRDRNA2_177434_c1_seq6.p1 gnl/TRDRNA2_/TRDRNA2_177434_c1~~gnl/TRDRNA2_/TRDRNA2_177434_c1_seq6.p1  ORF type:complete len:560 (-),score=-4.85 gnl/TRDRNA2_/TRDRNA2_177434_c1_seq6:1106-2785(-)
MINKTDLKKQTTYKKNICFSTDDKVIKRIKLGIDKLARVVGITMGPKGRNVVLSGTSDSPYIVNDGVTVAKNVFVGDPVENLGIMILQQAASKTNEDAGDGTSTATVLGAAMIHEGIKLIPTGVSPVETVKGIDLSVQSVIRELKAMSMQIQSDHDILNIASNSAGNNKQIGKIIMNALTKVGREGVVNIEGSMTTEDGLKIVEGMQIDRGYYSPYFATDNEKMIAEYPDCRLLLVDRSITGAREIIGQLEASIQGNYPLLILAESIDQEALATLIVNKLTSTLKVIAVKAPGYGNRRTSYLEDISILTGAKLIKADLGMRLENTDHSVLGSAAKVYADKSTCTIVGDGSQMKAVNARVQQLRTLLKSAETEIDKSKLNDRLAKLTRGVGIISIGARTEAEYIEKKLRVEDALCATRAAVAEGFVPGGGCTLFKITNQLDDILISVKTEEQKNGIRIVKKALMYPLRIIAANSGVNPSEVELKLLGSSEHTNMGYNAATNTFENLLTAGIIDPTKVLRCAIENASSVARTFILAGAIVYETPFQKNSRSNFSYEKETLY